MKRAVVTQFFRKPTGQPVIHAMTVIEEQISRDGTPYKSRTEYDVEWSRTYGYYLFHQSGGGGRAPIEVSGIYHVTGEVEIKEQPAQWVDARDNPPWRGRRTRLIRKRNRTRRLNLPPKHIQLEHGKDLLDWIEGNGADVDAVWCSECKDMVRGDYLCDHSWWCDKSGWYSTPSEPCGCADREECQA